MWCSNVAPPWRPWKREDMVETQARVREGFVRIRKDDRMTRDEVEEDMVGVANGPINRSTQWPV